MSKNTIKYEYTQGCLNDIIGILSQQSYKDKEDKLNSSNYANVKVEHGKDDITVKAVRYDKTLDQSGKIVERKDCKANDSKVSEELTH